MRRYARRPVCMTWPSRNRLIFLHIPPAGVKRSVPSWSCVPPSPSQQTRVIRREDSIPEGPLRAKPAPDSMRNTVLEGRIDRYTYQGTRSMKRALPHWSVILLCVSVAACTRPDPPAPSAKPVPPSVVANGQPDIQTMRIDASPSLPALTLSARVTYAEDGFSRISSPFRDRCSTCG